MKGQQFWVFAIVVGLSFGLAHANLGNPQPNIKTCGLVGTVGRESN